MSHKAAGRLECVVPPPGARGGDSPEAAIAPLEAGGYDAWKSPLMINNNIHGNEWEGTDASDWPPIFTPMYAMFHGVVGHTVEFPHNPRSGALSQAARHERTRVNTAIARATIESNFGWANENRMDVLADQLELYRRGAAGESSRPIDDELALSLAAGDNGETFLLDFPRAYVIPGGDGQRSDTAPGAPGAAPDRQRRPGPPGPGAGQDR